MHNSDLLQLFSRANLSSLCKAAWARDRVSIWCVVWQSCQSHPHLGQTFTFPTQICSHPTPGTFHPPSLTSCIAWQKSTLLSQCSDGIWQRQASARTWASVACLWVGANVFDGTFVTLRSCHRGLHCHKYSLGLGHKYFLWPGLSVAVQKSTSHQVWNLRRWQGLLRVREGQLKTHPLGLQS